MASQAKHKIHHHPHNHWMQHRHRHRHVQNIKVEDVRLDRLSGLSGLVWSDMETPYAVLVALSGVIPATFALVRLRLASNVRFWPPTGMNASLMHLSNKHREDSMQPKKKHKFQ